MPDIIFWVLIIMGSLMTIDGLYIYIRDGGGWTNITVALLPLGCFLLFLSTKI